MYHKYGNDEYFLREVNNLIRTFTEAEEKRNQIIHSCYTWPLNDELDDSIERIKLNSKGIKSGLMTSISKISLKDLSVINSQIIKATKELIGLYEFLFEGEIVRIG